VRINVDQEIPRDYDAGVFTRILRRITQQLNLFSEGFVQAATNATTGPPTTGTYQQGDFIRNSAPGSGEFFGWVCIVAGTPGTWATVSPIVPADPNADRILFWDDSAGKLAWLSLSGHISITTTTMSVNHAPITSSLGADVALNNTANYFDGPSIAQGSTGTWFASGSVVIKSGAAANAFQVKLWDGTTVIDSGAFDYLLGNQSAVISLSGYLAAPAGNLRISVRDNTATDGKIIFNGSGNSKDSTISAVRIA